MQQLIDRAAIHDLYTRYFQRIDRGSPEQVGTCFTDDVRAHYDKRTPTRGRAELIESLGKRDEWASPRPPIGFPDMVPAKPTRRSA